MFLVPSNLIQRSYVAGIRRSRWVRPGRGIPFHSITPTPKSPLKYYSLKPEPQFQPQAPLNPKPTSSTPITNNQAKSKASDVWRLLGMAKPEIKMISISMIALTISTASSLAFPYVIGGIVDLLSQPNAVDQLQKLSIGLIGLFAIGSVASFVRYVCSNIAGERILQRLRSKLFSHLIHQQIPFFDSSQTGELVNRLSTDTSMMSKGLLDNFSRAISQIVSGMGALAMLTYLSPKLATLIFVMVPPLAITAVVFGRKIKQFSRRSVDALSETTSLAQECFSSIRTLRAFSQENTQVERYNKLLEKVFQLSKAGSIWMSGWIASVYFVANVVSVAVLYFGSTEVMKGVITSGNLASFLFYTLYVAISFSSLSSFWAELMKTLGSSERVFELLDKPVVNETNHTTLPLVKGNINFQNIQFSYPTRPNQTILDNFNMSIEASQCIALVGHSGCGKSTIANLLLKFYEPTSGKILIDGMDASQLDSKWLRDNIGIVQQDIVLFSGTIFENILYGNPLATKEQVIEAAKTAKAHDFITSFAKGYETEVGEKGVQLSGGQKQRIGIARAILKNPPVLILDEATSALDVQNETQVQEAIQNLAKKTTLILIAHRLSTIKFADKIAVLQNGSVFEFGSFDELMQLQDGLFRNMVQKQIDF